MVVGGFGLAAGIQTPISAVMIVIFLIPTFALHWHWLNTDRYLGYAYRAFVLGLVATLVSFVIELAITR